VEIDILFLAIASLLVGIILAVIVVFASLFFGIDLLDNLWLLAIPVILAVILNIVFIELYRKYKKK
jgi:purine-cytosine permease-like protein